VVAVSHEVVVGGVHPSENTGLDQRTFDALYRAAIVLLGNFDF
jgi:hypothetical protein